MIFFVTGTDTNIGKTLVSSWLCIHLGYSYFKPIQTGSIDETDSMTVANLSKTHVHKETYIFRPPIAPHQAAKQASKLIDIQKINLPQKDNLIIEGAGGLLVPINNKLYMIDLIKKFNASVILVCRSKLGTINHTLLSLEALRKRNIDIAGLVISGEINKSNKEAICYYGKVRILAEIPLLKKVNYDTLKGIPCPQLLQNTLGEKQYEFNR